MRGERETFEPVHPRVHLKVVAFLVWCHCVRCLLPTGKNHGHRHGIDNMHDQTSTTPFCLFSLTWASHYSCPFRMFLTLPFVLSKIKYLPYISNQSQNAYLCPYQHSSTRKNFFEVAVHMDPHKLCCDYFFFIQMTCNFASIQIFRWPATLLAAENPSIQIRFAVFAHSLKRHSLSCAEVQQRFVCQSDLFHISHIRQVNIFVWHWQLYAALRSNDCLSSIDNILGTMDVCGFRAFLLEEPLGARNDNACQKQTSRLGFAALFDTAVRERLKMPVWLLQKNCTFDTYESALWGIAKMACSWCSSWIFFSDRNNTEWLFFPRVTLHNWLTT